MTELFKLEDEGSKWLLEYRKRQIEALILERERWRKKAAAATALFSQLLCITLLSILGWFIVFWVIPYCWSLYKG